MQTHFWTAIFSSLFLLAENIVWIHLYDICSPYQERVPGAHLSNSHTDLKVIHKAIAVTTPSKTGNWMSLLATHPNQGLVQFFITVISDGFCIVSKAPQISKAHPGVCFAAPGYCNPILGCQNFS